MTKQEQEIQEMNWPEVIDQAKDRFMEVKPAKMEFTAERAFAVQILKGNDYLMKCAKANKNSLLSAIFNVAAIGMSLNPVKKQAYLIPRKGVVCLDISYMGMCDIATSSGSIKWVQAEVVHANDCFLLNGPGEKPTHTFDPFAPESIRGAFKGVYCVAKTADGDYLTTPMSAEAILKIKNRSELGKKNEGPWVTDFNEQAKKTAIRRAYKLWPKTESTERLALAVELSNQNEGFDPIVNNPPLGDYSDDQKKFFDQLITSADAVGMFLFSRSIDEGTFTNLYHSFEKGSKGKYQGIVNDLVAKGCAKLSDIVEAINERASAGDDLGVMENAESSSDAEYEYIMDHVSNEASAMIRKMEAQ